MKSTFNFGIPVYSRSFKATSGLQALLSRMKAKFDSSSLNNAEHEISVMYYGRVSEFLMMTSERIAIPEEHYTLGQLLAVLRSRDASWAYELHASHLLCAINGKAVSLDREIFAGDEVSIASRKSIYGK